MYTIYWTGADGYYAKQEFTSWWETIGYIVKHIGLDAIACSDNNTVSIYEFNHRTQKVEKTIYRRNVFVYDEYDRIIPYSEIRDACKEYKKPITNNTFRRRPYWYKKRVFEFRADPVPYIGKHKGSRMVWPKHRYINTWIKAQDDPRARERLYSDWDGWPRTNTKSWKKYRKTQYKAY